ncbi:caspase-3-like [Ornithodoros turicata]|uniref:caspase-3-like n=1 Tax=Ornithodoros turicata TaxID=34597 RepID=UPI003139B0F8
MKACKDLEVLRLLGLYVPKRKLCLHLPEPRLRVLSPESPPSNKHAKVAFLQKVAGHLERIGTEKDKERIRTLFGGQLGFDVVVHDDLEEEAVLKTLKNLADEDHSSSYCLSLFLLSHGDDDVITCSDGKVIQLSKVYSMFDPETCKGLAAKPKLFFVQACRGDEKDTGFLHDGPTHTAAWSFKRTLPKYADFFVFYASSPGVPAYRDKDYGSVFIQTLCDVLERNFHHRDFLTMMTLVKLHVAKRDISFDKQSVKQMPNTNSTLRKNLRFAGQMKPSFKPTGEVALQWLRQQPTSTPKASRCCHSDGSSV